MAGGSSWQATQFSSKMDAKKRREVYGQMQSDRDQMADMARNAQRLGAKYWQYTDINGTVHKGESGARTSGGTYKREYDPAIYEYTQKSEEWLKNRQQQNKTSEANANWSMHMGTNRMNNAVSATMQAGAENRIIQAALRHKAKRKK